MSAMKHWAVLPCVALFAFAAMGQTNTPNNPTWWNKYQYLSTHSANGNAGPSNSGAVGANVDVSNECGPQSETFITVNTSKAKNLAGGSNEIFRLPMRAYASFDGGSSWSGTDAPLPPAKGANGIDFGSDPSLVFDTQGNLFYSYIVVFFGGGNGINGTEMAVAKSTDGGKSFPAATFFSLSGGSDHFNDKPMITADRNPRSPFRDNIYVAWDAASGGSSGGGIRVATSSDHGATFSVTRADNASGPGRSIGAVPFVGPNGELYVAWNDFAANAITFNRSFDGGATWGTPVVVSTKTLPFDIAIPAISFRGALLYPACDTDRSGGEHNGRLYCTWMDLTPGGVTDIFASFSDDNGATWSPRQAVTDPLGFAVDRFYPWLSVDPTNGAVNISFYDTRNDITGARYMTDVYFTQSTDGVSWRQPNTRVSSASSNEHDCNGVIPCSAINYGNQYGDYTGLVSYNGVSHPIWTDSRSNQQPASGCRTDLLMEEVFTAAVK
ncbi:MAG TPA: sialidase family protein [Terriglobales bacterium]|nr:sialidase family protein [Terriglobales bacterium]